jgi:hypothetical protein
VTGTAETTGCIFCDAAAAPPGNSGDSLVLVRGRAAYVILNLYPYNNGHLMVVPNRHVGTLAEAEPDELDELMRFTRDAEVALTEAYRPQGGRATPTSCRSSATCASCPRRFTKPPNVFAPSLSGCSMIDPELSIWLHVDCR